MNLQSSSNPRAYMVVLKFPCRYKELSLIFYTILMKHADDLQAVSVDEALIDVSNTIAQMNMQSSQLTSLHPAKRLAETIRAQVRIGTGCEGGYAHPTGSKHR